MLSFIYAATSFPKHGNLIFENLMQAMFLLFPKLTYAHAKVCAKISYIFSGVQRLSEAYPRSPVSINESTGTGINSGFRLFSFVLSRSHVPKFMT